MRKRRGRPAEQASDLGRRALASRYHRQDGAVGRGIANPRVLMHDSVRLIEQRHAWSHDVPDQPIADPGWVLGNVRVGDELPVPRRAPYQRVVHEGSGGVFDTPVLTGYPITALPIRSSSADLPRSPQS